MTTKIEYAVTVSQTEQVAKDCTITTVADYKAAKALEAESKAAAKFAVTFWDENAKALQGSVTGAWRVFINANPKTAS